ncbi:MAG: adenylosuccinate synthase [Parcubacteria group bacterium]|nr:adenylosuccinate synthase [Parcubacteria group bacterium]
MSITHVFDTHFGDGGKGKIVDLLAQEAHAVVRYHGGNNAGHTVENELGKFPLHLVPCGIFNENALACITDGVVLDLEVLADEIDMLHKVLADFRGRLLVSPRAHVIMPYHKILDRLYEETKGDKKTGTTGRGIGPCYADKVSYNGIRLGDLEDIDRFEELLHVQLDIKNKIIVALGGVELDFRVVKDEILRHYERIRAYVKEPFSRIHDLLMLPNKNIVLEGAHGVFLDTDWGTYPYVTASSIVPGNVNAGAGIPAQYITNVLGVVKAYTTRVGAGPFPTELHDEVGDRLRKNGKEFGTTTGRPRRCGWLDLELLRFSIQLCGITELAIMKLDVLDGLDFVTVCTGYTLDGKQVRYEDILTSDLARVEPVYRQLPGWGFDSSTRGVTRFIDLPHNAKEYLSFIRDFAGVPVRFVSTGPARHETINSFCYP